MATSKSWTADDLAMGALKLKKIGTDLQLEQRYFFEYEGSVIAQLGSGRIVELVAFSSLPSSVQDALVDIFNWTYEQALLQEGMED